MLSTEVAKVDCAMTVYCKLYTVRTVVRKVRTYSCTYDLRKKRTIGEFW